MKSWIPTLILGFALCCQPNADCQESTTQSVANDTGANIERANKLHEEAARLLEQRKIELAIAKEEEATKLVPEYWLPHAALGYLHFGRGGPALLEAAESVKTDHPTLADINLGLLLQYFHLYDDSIKTFEQVLKTNPQSIPAQVGLASSIIGRNLHPAEGRKMLDEACASAPNDPWTLDAIARAYFEVDDYQKTKELCLRALALSPDQRLTQKLQKLLLVAAVNTSDVGVAQSLKDKVTDLQPYERNWLTGFELQTAKTAAEGESFLPFTAKEDVANEQWLAYATVLQQRAGDADSDERTKWLLLEKNCLERAEKEEPNNVDIRMMLSSVEERLGQKQKALQKVTSGWSNAPFVPSAKSINANDEMARTDVTRLSQAVLENGKEYSSHISAIEVRMPKITCQCRYKQFRQAVKPLPGVVSVLVRSGRDPALLVVFDSSKASKKSIFESNGVTALHEVLELGPERPAATILELGDMVSRFMPTLSQPSFFAERVTLLFPAVDSKYQSIAGSQSMSGSAAKTD